MGLQFIAANEIHGEDLNLRKPESTQVDGKTLGILTMMVIDRFIENVEWEDVTSMYLAGLVDDDDLALIQRAVRALVDGGIEYVR